LSHIQMFGTTPKVKNLSAATNKATHDKKGS